VAVRYVLVKLVVLASLAALVLPSRSARADGLSVPETERLMRGETVVRTQTLDRGGRHYVGGVSYAVLDADADEVALVFDNANAWRRVLPEIRSTRAVGTAGDDPLIEVTHGNAIVQATYTMRVHREARGARFQLEPRRRHDIEDVWGFLRATPLADGRTILTYGVLIDMGPGLLRDLFEDRVRETAMTVPERIRNLMVERSATGRRASY
jgi:hypothetical protein